MAETPQNYEDLIPGDDVEMATKAVVEIEGSVAPSAAPSDDEEGNNELAFQGEEEVMDEDAPARVTYIDYLRSPIIGLLVGQGDEQALLTAHQMLLESSPWFKDACSKFSDEVSVSYPSFRRIQPSLLFLFLRLMRQDGQLANANA
jgi:hypothetical protein